METLECCLKINFNSQPHKEADKERHIYKNQKLNFNSQPHKEADKGLEGLGSLGVISTHSLTRRLTIINRRNRTCFIISTHSLTRRLTMNMVAVLSGRLFQLTASQGG